MKFRIDTDERRSVMVYRHVNRGMSMFERQVSQIPAGTIMLQIDDTARAAELSPGEARLVAEALVLAADEKDTEAKAAAAKARPSPQNREAT